MTDLEEFTLPKVSAINRYTSAYISGLHQHIPFLHLPTLDLNEVEIPRLLAMCSLGALYCFEKEAAMKLHSASMIFLGHVLFPVTPLDPYTDGVGIGGQARKRNQRFDMGLSNNVDGHVICCLERRTIPLPKKFDITQCPRKCTPPHPTI